ncbi:MAG: zf-HC2 domain-containing protein [Vicinamibacterales bacterium]
MQACEQYLNAINELVDGTLGPLRRAELDLHVERCEGCRALLADLRQIAQAAESLEPLEPPGHVWMQIAGQLRAEGRVVSAPIRSSRGNRTMLALAATLALAVGGSLFLLGTRGRDAPQTTQTSADRVDPTIGNPELEDPVQSVDSALAASEQQLRKVIEQVAKTENAVDPQTVAVLQKNFLVMNQAIAESRAALKSDPQNTQARQSLYDVLKQKIQFLQDTIALMNEMRKGDAAGAAQLVEGGKS